MKQWEDFKVKIDTATLEWFTKQCPDNGTRYYVYYLPATKEHDSGILIASETPVNDNYVLATPEPMRTDATVEREQYRLKELFFKLPVLGE